MKKYKFDGLVLEATRRCNKKCQHCMRGDAQNVTMSKEILNKVFEDVGDAKIVAVTGGEPLLEIDLLGYLVFKLIGSKWNTEMLELTTNGSICERSLINLLEQFCASKKGRSARLRISNDQFHDVEEYEAAYKFYKRLADDANIRIWKQHLAGGIIVEWTVNEGNELPWLLYDGRAVNIIDGGSELYVHGQNVKYPSSMQHRIKIIGDTVKCAIEISANGNVGFSEEEEFTTSDTLAFGNIMDDHLTAILDSYNDSCMLLCTEMDVFTAFKYVKSNSFEYMRICEMICSRIIELRRWAREQYSNVSAADIITCLPFPRDDEAVNLITQIYMNCPFKSENLLANIQRFAGTPKGDAYKRALCSAVITYLKNGNQRRFPYALFGNENDVLESDAFRKIRALDNAHTQKTLNTLNNKVFPCENDGLMNIDYGEEQ